MKNETPEPWWRRAVVYQIYTKSFMDLDSHGFGSLRGICDKLDYLQQLGIGAIWISPMFDSPMRDNGYDISDYRKIYPPYGTIEDFEILLNKSHKKGIRIIVDIVVNHTSTAHAWFRESRQSRTNPYRDYYIWRDGKDGQPPTNWLSKFGGSAWAYDANTGQYYLHLYDVSQADLNWENEEVRRSIYEMMRFWLDKGVDGFRLDVINVISKNQNFPDDEIGDGRRFYTDGPRIHEFLQEMNKEVFSRYDIMTAGEMSSTSISYCIKYTKPENKELNMTFNFHHLKVDYPNGEKWVNVPFDFLELKQILSTWQTKMHERGGWSALFWGNHDQPRCISRFGNDTKYHSESGKMLGTIVNFLKGTPFIFQGDEIGMTNPGLNCISLYRDVETLNIYKQLKERGVSDAEVFRILMDKSRDNGRTPMQWDCSENAGFTSGTPWIKVSDNYKNINVKEALENKDSIFYHYSRLSRIRKEHDVIIYGDYKLLLPNDTEIFAFLRTYKNEQLLVISLWKGATI